MKTTKTLRLETFEDRIVPSITPELIGNNIVIQGGRENDQIIVEVDPNRLVIKDAETYQTHFDSHQVPQDSEFYHAQFEDTNVVINLDGGEENSATVQNSRIDGGLFIGPFMVNEVNGPMVNALTTNQPSYEVVRTDESLSGKDTFKVQASTVFGKGIERGKPSIVLVGGQNEDHLSVRNLHAQGSVQFEDGLDRKNNGDDTIEALYSTIRGDLRIFEGPDAKRRPKGDTVTVKNVHAGGKLLVNFPRKENFGLGKGNDTYLIKDSQWGTGGILNFGKGDDQVKLLHNHFSGDLDIKTKGTLDALIKDIEVKGDFYVNLLAGGGDHLTIANAFVRENSKILGSDYLLIDRINTQNLAIFTDGGSDIVKILAAHVQYNVKINLGVFTDGFRNDNYVLLNNLNARNLTILGGKGDDHVDLFCLHIQNKIFVFLDGGYDSVYGNNVNAYQGKFIGGSGDDKLILEHFHIPRLFDKGFERYSD